MHDVKTKNRRLAKWLLFIAVLMFGFCYALVPFYNVLCKTLGINGKTGGPVSASAPHAKIDKERTVVVEFVATNNESLPWDFYPKVTKIRIHPGEKKQLAYYARNNTDKMSIG